MRKACALAIGAVLAATFAHSRAEAQSLDSQPAAAWAQSWPADSFILKSSSTSGGAWRGLIWPPMSGGAIDRPDLAAGGGLQGPGGQPLLLGHFGETGLLGQLAGGGLRRDWPSAVRLKTGGFGFDVTPHAGLDHSGAGDSRNAGALVQFGRGFGDPEGGRPSRWFLFASADQETLGMNFLRNEEPWKRVGLGHDPGAVISDTRAGMAWRDGPLEASVGYLYREIKPRDWDMLDAQSNHESLVAFRLSFHPGER